MKKLKYSIIIAVFALLAAAVILFALLWEFDDGMGIYKATEIEGDLGDDTWLQHAYNVDGITYLTATYTAKTDNGYESGIALFDIDKNGKINKLRSFANSFEKSDTGVKFSTYSGIIPTENGYVWGILREHSEYYAEDASLVSETVQKIVCCDKDGKQVKELDLTEALREEGLEIYAEQLFFGSGNEIILYGTGKTVVLDRNGKLSAYTTLEEGSHLENLVQLKGDGVVGIEDRDGKRSIVKINPRNAKVEILGELPVENAKNIYPANKGNRILIETNSALYSYNLALGTLRMEVNWINSGINPARLTVLSQVSENRVLVYEATEEYDSTSLMLLSPVEKEELPESEILNYCTLSVDENSAGAIIGYNNSQSEYRVAVRDYSIYNTGENMEKGKERLLRDIKKGKETDVINVTLFGKDTFPRDVALLNLAQYFPIGESAIYTVVGDFTYAVDDNGQVQALPKTELAVAATSKNPEKSVEFIKFYINSVMS